MYGSELNVTMDDMIAIMAILNDRGIMGAAATRLFRTAVSEAAREGTGLSQALDITNQEMDTYIAKIGEEAVGATQAYADAANSQFGIMDKLKSAWKDAALVLGTFLTPLEPIFALMTALGPLMMVMSMTTLPGLIANIKLSAIAFGQMAVAAGKAIAALVVKAAAALWASLGPLGVVGIALAVGGVIALAASMKKATASAREATAALAEGGIVTRPTRALIGEAGPEAVIPLSKMGGTGSKELHVHIGNYLGDEISLQKFGRRLKEILQEDERRSAFGQLGESYFYGRSGL